MHELQMVEEKLGDHIDWYGELVPAITDVLNDRNENSALPANHLLQEGS